MEWIQTRTRRVPAWKQALSTPPPIHLVAILAIVVLLLSFSSHHAQIDDHKHVKFFMFMLPFLVIFILGFFVSAAFGLIPVFLSFQVVRTVFQLGLIYIVILLGGIGWTKSMISIITNSWVRRSHRGTSYTFISNICKSCTF